MNKWMKNEQARKNIATRYLMTELFYEYGLRLKWGENPVNYAHRVWIKDAKEIPNGEIVSYQKEVVEFIKGIKATETYQQLVDGTASDELINEVEGNYEEIWPKKCKR